MALALSQAPDAEDPSYTVRITALRRVGECSAELVDYDSAMAH